MIKIKGQKDFLTGVLFISAGLFFAFFSGGLKIGTPAAMGPRFLPLVISALIIVIGLVQLVRGLVATGGVVDFKVKEPLVIFSSLIAFGYGLEKIGGILSILIVMLASAILHKKFTWKNFIISYVVLVILTLIFKYGLGSSIPLWIY